MIKLQFFYLDPSPTDMELPYADEGVQAGYPSPAQCFMDSSIDLNRELVAHPTATFYARVSGDSMEGEGICEGDILIVDKSLRPEHGDLAVCCVDGEFTLKRLRFLNGGHGVVLMPSNPRYPPIRISSENDFCVWGVVSYTIKANRRRRPGSVLW
ncbi:MAG: translesion error-prone DNA polymerase V autoproteolytic subunit [Muribaculaceae bacterium]|nr:translesion error-prone DNA polymerase V autoproteolytic subunit [Muribaculaceae bacterium]